MAAKPVKKPKVDIPKNETSKTELGIKMDTINSFDVTDNFNTTKQVQPKYADKLDPLESLKN